MGLERIGFDVREHLGDTLKGLAVRAFAEGIELAWRFAADVPHEVVGDPVRLRQVLLNLVGNAIKFTRRGKWSLTLRWKAAMPQGSSPLLRDRYRRGHPQRQAG